MLRLKRPLRATSNADPEDTLATKLHLAGLGFYKPPTGEFHEWPDAEMFAGLRMAQEAAGERVDGEMLPGGPTEAAINRLSASRPPIPKDQPNADRGNWGEAIERQTGYVPTPAAARKSKDYLGSSGDILVPRSSFFGGGGGGLGPRSLNPRPGEILPGRQGIGGGSAAPSPPNLLEEPAAGANGRGKADPSLMEAEGWHREALPPEKQEPMRGPSAEEIDRLNRELSKPLTGPSPEPIEVTPETFPAELPTIPQILIFPDQSGEIDQFTILDRKGNAKTKAQLDSIRDWFLDRKWTHLHGGRIRETKEEEQELWIPNSAYVFGGDGRRGGRFVDLTMKSPDGKIVHIQTVTLDKNGKPKAEELEAAEAIRRATGDHVILVPKNWQLRRGGSRSSRGK